jgi:hypothetical protein
MPRLAFGAETAALATSMDTPSAAMSFIAAGRLTR